MICHCPTEVAHPGGCTRSEPSDNARLCSFCFYGHNEVVMTKYRVSKDTPVALIIEAESEDEATEASDDKFARIWQRLDEVALELQTEFKIAEVVIGFPYDDIEVSVEDDSGGYKEITEAE